MNGHHLCQQDTQKHTVHTFSSVPMVLTYKSRGFFYTQMPHFIILNHKEELQRLKKKKSLRNLLLTDKEWKLEQQTKELLLLVSGVKWLLNDWNSSHCDDIYVQSGSKRSLKWRLLLKRNLLVCIHVLCPPLQRACVMAPCLDLTRLTLN